MGEPAELSAGLNDQRRTLLKYQPPRYQPPKYLMSIREAAEALGVGRSTAYGLMAQGKLATIQIGRRRLIPTESVLAIVKGEAA